MSTADIVAKLARAWNTPDEDERLGLLRETCREDAEFASPHGQSHGLDEYARGIALFRKSFKKARAVHGVPDEHHGFFRFAWTTQWNDGRPPVVGADFGELDQEGKVRRLVSFTGTPTAPGALAPPAPRLPGIDDPH
jgi:hypothetical protein